MTTATAVDKNELLARRLQNRGIDISWTDAGTLRKAERTLQHWFEQECGNSDNYKSWAIERDEETDLPYMVTYPHNGNKARRHRIADRETGAIKRIDALCKRLGIYHYIQTDPRGASLYVSKEPLNDTDYNKGVCCAV